MPKESNHIRVFSAILSLHNQSFVVGMTPCWHSIRRLAVDFVGSGQVGTRASLDFLAEGLVAW